ncbi:MAG: hypothetical protein SFX18_00065 [Pirellulales bacterium]|nr:hypothetical protein [Pirellulales bacterium]
MAQNDMDNGNALPDLIKITEIFLIPSSFLVGALGTADTNPHRAAVSALGLLISLLWLVCARESLAEAKLSTRAEVNPNRPLRVMILLHLSTIFAIGWLISLVAHLALWNRPLGS